MQSIPAHAPPAQLLFEANGLCIAVVNLDADIHGAQLALRRKVSSLHAHHYYEVFFIREGAARLITPTGAAELPLGSVCVVAPDTLHYIYSVHDQWRVLNLSFSCRAKDSHDRVLSQALAQLRAQIGMYYISPQPQLLQAPLARMADYAASTRKERGQLAGACVYEFVHLLIGSFSGGMAQPEPTPAQQGPAYRSYVIDDFINSNYHQDITLDQLSTLVHLSTHQLSRVIRSSYGQSFQQRVAYLRMKNAEKLIRETQLGVEQIALLVGYASLRGFYTAFEKQYGLPPGQYRRNAQSNPR